MWGRGSGGRGSGAPKGAAGDGRAPRAPAPAPPAPPSLSPPLSPPPALLGCARGCAASWKCAGLPRLHPRPYGHRGLPAGTHPASGPAAGSGPAAAAAARGWALGWLSSAKWRGFCRVHLGPYLHRGLPAGIQSSAAGLPAAAAPAACGGPEFGVGVRLGKIGTGGGTEGGTRPWGRFCAWVGGIRRGSAVGCYGCSAARICTWACRQAPTEPARL
jgi:hypothetical protein